MLTLVQLLKTVLPKLDKVILGAWMRNPISLLNKWLHDGIEEPNGKEIPLPIFTVYTEFTEEYVFLCRLHNYTRSKLIEFLPHFPHMKWECSPMEYEGDNVLSPLPVAKLSQRRMVPWKDVYRCLWPHSYETIGGNAPRQEEPTYVYQSYIHYEPFPIHRSNQNDTTSSAVQ